MLAVAGIVFAGASGLTNGVKRTARPKISGGPGSLQKQIIDFNDDVVTLLDSKLPYTQSDTNVTTVVTNYTPKFAGQILLGGAGTGTNAAWVAKGTTPNDWVQVAP